MRWLIGGLAVLAISLTGCSATAEGAPVPTTPAGTPFDISELLPNPTTPIPNTPCAMIGPGHWLCPKGFDAPN